MAWNQQQLEQGSNSNSNDGLAGVSALTRGAVEVMVIQTLQRVIEPILVPLVRRVVKEEIGLAQQKLLTSMKENPANKASTSAPKNLELRFRNKISQPVLSGKKLLGENETPIEIALVDALTDQIVNTGTESTAKLEIVVLQEGDDDVDGRTFEKFQNKIVSEKKGKQILQGNTYVHLKEGIGFMGEISFTHNSDWTKNGKYRLGARAVDSVLMTRVEGARTEAFLIKDKRSTLYEKHYPPSLLDRVYHLEQISVKGVYYKRLKDAKVNTVKQFLTILLTKPKRLEEILKVKASSRIWNDMVNHAQTCKEMFLYLDPSYEQKTGVVIDVKLQLKGLITESQYIPVDQLTDKQKVDSQNMVQSASERFEVLESFKDETSLKEFLQSGISLNSLLSANKSLGSPMVTNGLPSPSSQVTYSSFDVIEAPDKLDNSNSHMGQSPNYAPVVTSQSDRGEKTVPSEKEPHPDNSFHPPSLESPNELYFGPPTERHAHDPTQPGTRVRDVDFLYLSPDRPIYSPDFYEECLRQCLNYDTNIHFDNPNNEWPPEPLNFDTNVTVVTVCSNAQTRWTKVSKLLRGLSVRERISLSEGIHAQKKQRCC